MRATVENTGSGPSGEISLTANLFDSEGSYIQEWYLSLPTLGPGETWLGRTVVPVSDPSRVADFEFNTEVVQPPPTTTVPMTLVDDRRLMGDSSIKMTGTVRNDGDQNPSTTRVIVTLYDEEGRVLDGQETSIYDFPPRTEQDFEIQFFGYNRLAQVASHEITVANSVL